MWRQNRGNKAHIPNTLEDWHSETPMAMCGHRLMLMAAEVKPEKGDQCKRCLTALYNR